jgi:hypothetical protein
MPRTHSIGKCAVRSASPAAVLSAWGRRLPNKTPAYADITYIYNVNVAQPAFTNVVSTDA